MEYLSKILSVDKLKKGTILLNEHLGASCDLVLGDILSKFPLHTIFSLCRLSSEYPSSVAFSLLEDPSAYSTSSSRKMDLFIIDGWNLRVEEYALPSCAVLLINRSIVSPPYRDMYWAYIAMQVHSLQSRSLLYTNSLSISIREERIEINLLYKDSLPLIYAEVNE